MMFSANPKVDLKIGMLPNGEDLKEMSKNKSRTRLLRAGMLVMGIGFLTQLVALIIPAIKV